MTINYIKQIPSPKGNGQTEKAKNKKKEKQCHLRFRSALGCSLHNNLFSEGKHNTASEM